MAYQYALYEKKGKIAYITINRPDVMNAVHPPLSAELWEIWSDFRDDPNVWVAILTGAGDRAFSAGNDLKYAASRAGDAGAQLAPNPGGFGGITAEFECWKPMIAALNGLALGGGLEMALACDIIIAAEHARLGLPEPTVGFMAAAGGVHRLPRMIPQKIALGMLLTGKPITAQEAYRLGLVNEVVPADQLMATAERWANDILQCAPISVRASKQAAMLGLRMPLDEALKADFELVKAWRTSEDLREGPLAFAQKRKPEWKGR